MNQWSRFSMTIPLFYTCNLSSSILGYKNIINRPIVRCIHRWLIYTILLSTAISSNANFSTNLNTETWIDQSQLTRALNRTGSWVLPSLYNSTSVSRMMYVWEVWRVLTEEMMGEIRMLRRRRTDACLVKRRLASQVH